MEELLERVKALEEETREIHRRLDKVDESLRQTYEERGMKWVPSK